MVTQQWTTRLADQNPDSSYDIEPSLRILCLNYEYPPMGGGAGNATHHTATNLARRGHTVHVLTARLPAEQEVETMDGVVVCRVRCARRSLMECGLMGAASYVLFALFKLMRLARTYNYDVYQFYFGLPTGLLALYVHLVLRKPYFLALRGSDVPGYDESAWYMRPLHSLLRPLTRYLWRRASAVTVISKSLKTLALQTCPDIDSVLIKNGIDAMSFPAKQYYRQRHKIRIVTVCRMVRRKGLEYLIQAMRELRNDGIELELIGSGQEYERVAGLVRQYDLESCVSMCGYVPRSHLYRHYHHAEIFVLPSLSESFGQVLLEAMSCGLPIVATRVGGIPEIVHHRKSGILVPAADSDALVKAIRLLGAQPRMRASMGQYNALRSREDFDWSSIASQYETLFMRVYSGESTRRDAS